MASNSEKKESKIVNFFIVLFLIIAIGVSLFAIYEIFLLNSIEDTVRYILMSIIGLFDLLFILKTRKLISKKSKTHKISEYKNYLNEDKNAATEYETLLQKLEESIRQHISYEHQFKIEYEKLLNKAEEIDLEKKMLTKQIIK